MIVILRADSLTVGMEVSINGIRPVSKIIEVEHRQSRQQGVPTGPVRVHMKVAGHGHISLAMDATTYVHVRSIPFPFPHQVRVRAEALLGCEQSVRVRLMLSDAEPWQTVVKVKRTKSDRFVDISFLGGTDLHSVNSQALYELDVASVAAYAIKGQPKVPLSPDQIASGCTFTFEQLSSEPFALFVEKALQHGVPLRRALREACAGLLDNTLPDVPAKTKA